MAMGMTRAMGRSGQRRGRARTAPMAEINVTPFVDVMLVLLVIFMVAAPLLTAGIELDLPQSRAEALPSEQDPPLTVSVDATGTVFLQESRVQPGALDARLVALAEARRGGRVFVRADQGLPYGRVMEVMGALSAAGFRDISLVSDQRVASPG